MPNTYYMDPDSQWRFVKLLVMVPFDYTSNQIKQQNWMNGWCTCKTGKLVIDENCMNDVEDNIMIQNEKGLLLFAVVSVQPCCIRACGSGCDGDC